MWCVWPASADVPVWAVGASRAAVSGPVPNAVGHRQCVNQAGVSIRAGGGAVADGAGPAALARDPA